MGIKEEEAEWADNRGGNPESDVDPVSKSTTCCMRKVLTCQPDFLCEKSMLEEYLEEAGHICRFIPKFHCEFNPIEMYWGWVKRSQYLVSLADLYAYLTRTGFRYLADGTFTTGKVLLPELLDSCEPKTIRAFFRKSWRYMDAYR